MQKGTKCRYFIYLSYNGTRYHGWQVQPNANTVQAEINKALIDKIADLQEQVSKLISQKERLENAGKNYLAPNDPDANLMKSRDGWIPGYNGQTVIDKKNRMITVGEISTEANDINELKNNVDNLKEQLDKDETVNIELMDEKDKSFLFDKNQEKREKMV